MIPASRRIFRGISVFLHHEYKSALSNLVHERHYSKEQGLSLEYSEYGDPSKVLKCVRQNLPEGWDLKDQQVVVKMLMAPINPSDINMIEGTYMLKPKLPAVAGNEGVGKVIAVGPGVASLKVGDWVLPSQAGFGTWRTHILAAENNLLKIRNDIPPLSAATLAVNPCTAYRMLKDFVPLRPGDTVIQNAANSGVGQSVIQIAKAWGINTINVVRKRDNLEELTEQLTNLGATCVITEEFLRTPEMKEMLKSLEKPPRLALNGVGGPCATELIRCLTDHGIMVTYGGMSKKPVTIPTGLFIFKNVQAVGYWNSQWNHENESSEERHDMLNELCDMINNCKLIPPPCQIFEIEHYGEAIKEAMSGFQEKKKILSMQEF